jgi:hypothetical protein
MIMWLGSGAISMSHDLVINDDVLSPVQVLERAILTEDVTLDNSPDIYLKVANLFDQPGVVKTSVPDITSGNVNLAWASNPVSDTQTYKILLRKNLSILGAIQQIAASRREVLDKSRNFVVIRPAEEKQLRSTYEENTEVNQNDLAREVNALIPYPVHLLQLPGDPMENFINYKLKESAELFYKNNTSSFTFRMDEGAKAGVGKINLIGTWSYREFLDALCALADLHWRIEGKTLWLEKSDAGR